MAKLELKKAKTSIKPIAASALAKKKTATPAEGTLSKDTGAPEGTTVLDAESGRKLTEGELQQLIENIKGAHGDAVHAATGVVQAAARGGEYLLQAKEALKGEKFTDWVTANLPMSWRTAYDYMKVYEATSRHSIDISGCTSIRQVLELCSSKDTKPKKDGDDKPQESFVTWVTKIEKWFESEVEKTPVADWPDERRATCRTLFKGVYAIYRQLAPPKGAGDAGTAAAATVLEPAAPEGEAAAAPATPEKF